MDIGKILDNNSFEIEETSVFKFQVIEFALIGLFCGIVMLKLLITLPKIDFSLSVLGTIIIPLFSLVRIYFEYKNKLITGVGIVLKLYLLMLAFFAFCGVIFQVNKLPYASEMYFMALTSFTYAYFLYAIILKNVSKRIKAILCFNAIGLALLALGFLLKIKSWPDGEGLVVAGFALTIISLPVFGLILGMKPTPKEKYHSINYFGRTIAVLLLAAFLF